LSSLTLDVSADGSWRKGRWDVGMGAKELKGWNLYVAFVLSILRGNWFI
jgi:hypothetical protein